MTTQSCCLNLYVSFFFSYLTNVAIQLGSLHFWQRCLHTGKMYVFLWLIVALRHFFIFVPPGGITNACLQSAGIPDTVEVNGAVWGKDVCRSLDRPDLQIIPMGISKIGTFPIIKKRRKNIKIFKRLLTVLPICGLIKIKSQGKIISRLIPD